MKATVPRMAMMMAMTIVKCGLRKEKAGTVLPDRST